MRQNRLAVNAAQGGVWRLNRRRLLGIGGASAIGLFAGGALGMQTTPHVRALSFYNPHTGENLSTEYWAEGRYIPEALAQISHVLRDHASNAAGLANPALLDILHMLRRATGSREAFHVHAGYRAPSSKERLIALAGGVPSRSLHLQGRALDISLPGCASADLRRAALGLCAGGVGYYPASGLVHIDSGPVQSWSC